jgi:hypothetical protein
MVALRFNLLITSQIRGFGGPFLRPHVAPAPARLRLPEKTSDQSHESVIEHAKTMRREINDIGESIINLHFFELRSNASESVSIDSGGGGRFSVSYCQKGETHDPSGN